MYVFLLVMTGSIFVQPSASSFCWTTGDGRGVILSIMLHGNATLFLSESQLINSGSAKPFFTHSFAMNMTAASSFSPLCEQLSMLANATGCAPFKKRVSASDVTTAMACLGCAGPL